MKGGLNMEPWIIYSLIASLAFGSNVIVYKLGMKNFNPYLGTIFFSMGVMIACIAGYLILKRPEHGSVPALSMALIILSGIIWAIGFIAITTGIAQNYEISKMSVIFNTNALVTIALSILIFKELSTTSELIRTLIGAAFVMVGVVIISLK